MTPVEGAPRPEQRQELAEEELSHLGRTPEAMQAPKRVSVSILDWRELAIETEVTPMEEGILASLQRSLPEASIELADISRAHDYFAKHLETIPVPTEPAHRHATLITARGHAEANAVLTAISTTFNPDHPLWEKVHVRILYPNPKAPNLLELYAVAGAYVPTIPPDKRQSLDQGE